MKIYTKQGDEGKTSLVGGVKIEKSNEFVEAYGNCDELNVMIGTLIHLTDLPILTKIQNYLFVIGGVLATDSKMVSQYWDLSSIAVGVQELENEIDNISENLPPLNGFLLPQGSEIITRIHLCRVTTRRAERAIHRAHYDPALYAHIFQFMNRLSDYFFVLARHQHHIDKIAETYWVAEKRQNKN